MRGSGLRISKESEHRPRHMTCTRLARSVRRQGSGFRVQNVGFRVQGVGFRAQGLGRRVSRMSCFGIYRKVHSLYGVWFRDQGS